MWQLFAMEAMDIARERTAEAERTRTASQARAFAAAERRRHGRPAIGRGRASLVRVLRTASNAFETLSDAACDAASRVERRTT